jgi:hypothetical protein
VPIVGVGDLGFSKRRDRRIALAELFANFSQRKPGGGKAGRQLSGLREQIGSGDEIAFQLQIPRKIEPPVGNQIAGGQEYSRGHGLYIRHCRTPVPDLIGDDPAILPNRILPEDGCAGQARA